MKQGNSVPFSSDQGGYLTHAKIKWPFWTITNEAELRRIRPHDIRHSFASQLIIEGVHLRKVQVLLGHSTIKMTELYSHLAPNDTQDAVNLLD